MNIQEKIERPRTLGYQVQDQVGSRPTTGENVLQVNGRDIDERFVDQLILGANSAEVQIRRNRWLANR